MELPVKNNVITGSFHGNRHISSRVKKIFLTIIFIAFSALVRKLNIVCD